MNEVVCSECGEGRAESRGLCNRCYLRVWRRGKHEEYERKKRRGRPRRKKDEDDVLWNECECGQAGVERVILHVGFKPVVFLLCADCLEIERSYGRVVLSSPSPALPQGERALRSEVV